MKTTLFAALLAAAALPLAAQTNTPRVDSHAGLFSVRADPPQGRLFRFSNKKDPVSFHPRGPC